MSTAVIYRWNGEALLEVDYCDPAEERLEVADSFLVSDGTVFGLSMHRDRFTASARIQGDQLDGYSEDTAAKFWDAALRALPPTGLWFPRLELRSRNGAAHFLFRHRSAPELASTIRLASHVGPDPRRTPAIKGSDLDALLSARGTAQRRGADDVVLLTPDGYVLDGGMNAIVWWRGDILCGPPDGDDDDAFTRIDSVTARSMFAIAAALGVETHRERVTPAELDGTEVWALNALHGIRIATLWVDGPQLAELPGRIGGWRERRDVLRKPILERTQ